jgi:hypothetical protein
MSTEVLVLCFYCVTSFSNGEVCMIRRKTNAGPQASAAEPLPILKIW